MCIHDMFIFVKDPPKETSNISDCMESDQQVMVLLNDRLTNIVNDV